MVKVDPGPVVLKFEPILTAMSITPSPSMGESWGESVRQALSLKRWSVVTISAILLAFALLACEPNTRKAEAAYSRGVAAQGAEDHSKAIEEFTEAIKQDPEMASYYYSRGVSYEIGGNDRLALDDFTRAIDRDPEMTDAFQKRATLYNATGEFRRAVLDFDRAIELNPSFIKAHYGKAVALVAMNLRFRALESFDRAIELDPSNPEYYAIRGMTYALDGNIELAALDIDKAVELGFDDQDVISTFQQLSEQ